MTESKNKKKSDDDDKKKNNAPSLQFSALLGSTIESIVHELLHSRSIYPPDSFVLHRHLGVRCHASRVPQVGDYIADFLRVAIPSIVAGVADNLSLIILEEEVATNGGGGNDRRREVGERTGGTKTVERFVFQFHMEGVIASDENTKPIDIEDQEQRTVRKHVMEFDEELAKTASDQMERSMRECLLRVMMLRKRRRRNNEKPENMSFKLCLHVAEEDDKEQQFVHAEAIDGAAGREVTIANSCPELINALQKGEWLQPADTSCLFSPTFDRSSQQSSKGLLRPIKHVDLPSCGMRMQFGMEVDPF